RRGSHPVAARGRRKPRRRGGTAGGWGGGAGGVGRVPPPQGRGERLALGVLVAHDAVEIGWRQSLDERLLLRLEPVPPRAQLGQRREVAIAHEVARRRALPARQPDEVGRIKVREHALQRRKAELLADLAPRRLLTERANGLE